MEITKILLCTDGQDHTIKAEEYAIALAKKFDASLVAIYVVDPFLQKFTNEIYAVSRDECRDYLNRALSSEGHATLENMKQRAARLNVPVQSLVIDGPPEEVIKREAETGAYDMVIMGAKMLRTWKQRFESFNLPEKIFRNISVPILYVK